MYVFALLSGAKSYEDIGRFAKVHLDVLKEYFGFKWKAVPHYTQIRRILIKINWSALEAAFRQYSHSLVPEKGVRQICFDGKTLRGSKNSSTALLNAFEAFSEIVLAHLPLTDKASEIPALQAFLQQLDVKEVVVTADAIHCQKKLLG